MNETEKTKRIAEMNDTFRMSILDPSGPRRGRLMITRGIQQFPVKSQLDLIRKVMYFRDFTEDNDPWKERDFGNLIHEGQKVYFKIDYYADDTFTYGSEDPTDVEKTVRVLTIMLAEEY